MILRINASNIKIIDSFTETVRQDYAIDCVSFAAQDSNHELVFRKTGAIFRRFLSTVDWLIISSLGIAVEPGAISLRDFTFEQA